MTCRSATKPLIVFDPHLEKSNSTIEGDCACSNDYGIYRTGEVTMAMKDAAGLPLIQVQPVIHTAICDEYVLLMTPYGIGQPVVVNRSAYSIWQAFAQPQTLVQVADSLQDLVPYTSTANAAIRFHQLSLLQIAGSSHTVDSGSPDTLVVWLHVTNQCNLHCAYCYLRKTTDVMSLETGKRSINAAFRSAIIHGFRRVKIKYAGGEPMLRFPVVLGLHRYALELAEKHSIKLDEVILSNGIGITNEMIGALKADNIRLMISLDGVGKYHDAQRMFANSRGSFEIVSKTIDRLINEGLKPNISITISARNLDGLPETVEYVIKKDLLFSLNFCRESDHSTWREDLHFSDERLISAMKRTFQVIGEDFPQRSLLGSLIDRAHFVYPHNRACGVGYNYLVIDPYGRIAKCHMELNKIVTDINAEDPLKAVREDQASIQNLSVEEKEGCKDCLWRYWCAGGCPLETFRATGRYDTCSPHCSIYRALIPEALRLEALRIVKYEADQW